MVIIFKYIGIIFVVSASVLCGNFMAIRLSKRAEVLAQMAQLCAEVGEKIRFFAIPVEQIIKECQKKYEGLYFLQSYPEILPQYPLTQADMAKIKDFFAGLGASDICGQQKHCEAYTLQFNRLADSAKGECDSKNRLYRVLGFFGGICITVLLV